MIRRWPLIWVLALLLPVTALRAQDDEQQDAQNKTEAESVQQEEGEEAAPQTPAEQLAALQQEYMKAVIKWQTEARQASQEGKPIDMTTRPNPATFAPKFFALAKDLGDDPVAAEALYWIVGNARQGQAGGKAFALLLEKFPKSEKIGPACLMLGQNISPSTEDILRDLMQRESDTTTQGLAHYALSAMLKTADRYVTMLDDAERAKQIEDYYGKDMVEYLQTKDSKAIQAELEQLFQIMLDKYREVESPRGNLGEIAERELFEIRNLAIGCTVPDIVAEDLDGTEFKLSDYRGKVVMIDFWGDW